MDLYKSRDNVYKTIDLRSSSLPAEMTCMLDVIGGTPSSTTATPARCDCVGGVGGVAGGGLRMSPSGACLDGAFPVSCNGSPAGHGEVYFSEEVLRQTLGRCRTRSPRSAGGAGGAAGGDPSPLVDATSTVNHASVSHQVSPSSSPTPSFLLGKGQTVQQQPPVAPLGTFRGYFSPYPSPATNEEKVYEATQGPRRQLAPNPGARTS